jgi:hypothetical protein
LLREVAARHQQGVRSVDHDQIVHAEQRHGFAAGNQSLGSGCPVSPSGLFVAAVLPQQVGNNLISASDATLAGTERASNF